MSTTDFPQNFLILGKDRKKGSDNRWSKQIEIGAENFQGEYESDQSIEVSLQVHYCKHHLLNVSNP